MQLIDKQYIEKQANKNYKDLIGKSLKIVHEGSKTYPEKDNPLYVHIDEAYIIYVFKIKNTSSEPWKNIDYLNGMYGVSIEFWGISTNEKTISMTPADQITIDFHNKDALDKEQFYLIDEDEGLNEIKNYFYNNILSGYELN